MNIIVCCIGIVELELSILVVEIVRILYYFYCKSSIG